MRTKNNGLSESYFFDIYEEPIILPKKLIDILSAQEYPSDCIALFCFYYYHLKYNHRYTFQSNNTIDLSIKTTAKKMKWGIHHLRKIKKILRDLNLIEDVQTRDENNLITGWNIKIKFKYKISHPYTRCEDGTSQEPCGWTLDDEKYKISHPYTRCEDGTSQEPCGSNTCKNDENDVILHNDKKTCAEEEDNKDSLLTNSILYDKNKKESSSSTRAPAYVKPLFPPKNLIVENQFERFWKIYPKKAGKGSALTSWNKLCRKKERPTFLIIKNAINDQKQSEQWKDPMYIPHPATWLNQSRWLDDPSQMKSFSKNNKVTIGYKEPGLKYRKYDKIV